MSEARVVQATAAAIALADGTCQMACTSPPYYQARDYHTPPQVWGDGWRGELGLEPTPEQYIAHLVQVFREVRRVLRDDGVMFVNIGDSMASKPFKPWGVKPKDELGIPDELVRALRMDGWYRRSTIIWAKGLSFLPDYAGSCMPESVTDRPTKAHETVFLLSKRADYFYDAESVKEGASNKTVWTYHQPDKAARAGITTNGTGKSTMREETSTRNLRSVWAINPKPSSLPHYAMMPERLAETCIKAGTSARGACQKCGAPWERTVEKVTKPRPTSGPSRGGASRARVSLGICGQGGTLATPSTTTTTTTGWRATCGCEAGDPVPCRVIDPFSGTGTTGRCAVALGRDYIGIELSGEYVGLHERRLTTTEGMNL